MSFQDNASQAIRKLNAAVTDLRARQETFAQLASGNGEPQLEQWKRLELGAARALPFWYTIEIVLETGTTAKTPGSVQIISRGYFIFKRLYCTWRLTGGNNAGEFRNLSSRANLTDTMALNFGLEYCTTDSERNRQNNLIPGDLFARYDRDGILPTPDILVPATDVEFSVTPYVATPEAGIFTVVLEGTQCLNVLEDA